MLFDDRLATVLRSGAAGEQAARTQYRQLLDLLGSTPPGANGPLVMAAYRRLGDLEDTLAPAEQARILREPWLRLRNPRLLAHLAESDPQACAAAMAAARLEEDDWMALIPRLPVTARGFLRHRRDMPERVRGLLGRLGVRDLVLPHPARAPLDLLEPIGDDGAEADEMPAPAASDTAGPDAAQPGAAQPGAESDAREDISALVRRIEAFQQARRGVPVALAPRLPLDDGAPVPANGGGARCDFSTDPGGRIDWAEPGLAPLLVGLRLDAPGVLDGAARGAMRLHQPVRGGEASLPGAPAIAGEWRLDAAPVFTAGTGAFAGYRGRLRRPFEVAGPAGASGPADRMRQVLHELRTPVGAVQGFAEIIQQQLFGPAPNTYRALAAAVAVDAARLLAGFDEIDRMVRLESGASEISTGGSNLRQAIERTVQRLDGVMRPRSARMRLLTSGDTFAVALGGDDAAQLAWRVLATIAGALAPGEIVELALRDERDRVTLAIDLPVSLAEADDLFAGAAPSQAPAVTAGMFGTGFTLRLARAEAEAAGGSLVVDGDALVLALPALTAGGAGHSNETAGGAGA